MRRTTAAALSWLVVAGPALATAACPGIGRQILGPFGAEAPVYNVATNAVVDHVKVVKGVVSPILVIVACPGRYFIAQENGKMVAVARADVIYGEPFKRGYTQVGDLHGGRANNELVSMHCASNLHGSRNENELTAKHAVDPMLCAHAPFDGPKQ